MAETLTGAIVTAAWLAEHLQESDIRILDCTCMIRSTNLDGRNQYRGRHLPGPWIPRHHHIADPNSDRRTHRPMRRLRQKGWAAGVGDGDRVMSYHRLFGGSAAAR